jgi:uncharacterized protein (TIGR02246 family)
MELPMAGVTAEETDRLIAEAISRQDLEAALDLYEPDAVFIDPDSGAELRGHEQIRAGLHALFEAQPRLEGEQVRVFQAGEDLALVLSKWTMTGSGTDGEAFELSGVATDVMRRQSDGTWRYVIDNPAGISRLSEERG